MGRGPITIRMEPNTKETSKPANDTAMGSTNMLTAQYTRVTGLMVNAKAKASLLGLMKSVNMKVSGPTTYERV